MSTMPLSSSSLSPTHMSSSDINLVSKRRYLAPPQELEKYGARPLLIHSQDASVPANPPATAKEEDPALSSAKSQTENNNQDINKNDELVGVSICGWDVATSQGPIGDHVWFDATTELLERSAQFNKHRRNNDDGGGDGIRDVDTSRGRKIVLPEMVFPHAHVFIEQHSRSNSSQDFDNGKGPGGPCIAWDAVHALREWSEAHQNIPLPNRQREQPKQEAGVDGLEHDDTTSVPSLTASFRGVSVLESNDARLWKHKRRSVNTSNTSDTASSFSEDGAVIDNTTFHYDWTYSTPFVGKILVGDTNGQEGNGNDDSNIKNQWCPLEESGMDMSLLTDQTVPILFYDQIDLYEDDLHDNGFIEYGVKVRVMPTCIYVLARLFLRIDHVLVRVRDARWLVDFRQQNIFRDVTWREAYWNQLGRLQLPTEVKSWTAPTERQQVSHHHQQEQSQTGSGRELQAFQSLLYQLPVVDPKDMPSDLPLHAKWSYET